MPKVNPEILSWARETAGLTLEEAVGKLKIRDAHGVAAEERLAALESGETEPTRQMLVKMAKQYRRPLVTFYLSTPPAKGDRGADFRTLPSQNHYSTAEAVLDALVRDLRARQSMVRAVLEDEDEAKELPIVGSNTISDGRSAVLVSLRDFLAVGLDEYRRQPNADAAFGLLRGAAERAGVFVLLKGDLGSYHTAIDVEIFRGLTIADDIAPFVVLNDRDARAVWSFTLLQELTHLILGDTGIGGARSEQAIERFCDDVAGEFLLPQDELQGLIVDDTQDQEAFAKRISEFARERNVSRTMVAYKAWRTAAINEDAYEMLASKFRQQWIGERATLRERAQGQDGGPNYYVVRRHRVGSGLMDLARRMMGAGALTTSSAAKVLGVKPQQVQALLDTGALS